MMGAAENHGQGWQTAPPSELFGGIGGGYEWTNRIGLVGHRVNHSTRPGRSDGSASLPSTEATIGLQFGWFSSSAAFVSSRGGTAPRVPPCIYVVYKGGSGVRIGANDFKDLAEASVRIGAASVQQSGARDFKDLAEASVQTAGASVHPSSGIGAGSGAGTGAASVRPMPTRAPLFVWWPPT